MNRRAFIKTAGVLSAAGAISATNVASASASEAKSILAP